MSYVDTVDYLTNAKLNKTSPNTYKISPRNKHEVRGKEKRFSEGTVSLSWTHADIELRWSETFAVNHSSSKIKVYEQEGKKSLCLTSWTFTMKRVCKLSSGKLFLRFNKIYLLCSTRSANNSIFPQLKSSRVISSNSNRIKINFNYFNTILWGKKFFGEQKLIEYLTVDWKLFGWKEKFSFQCLQSVKLIEEVEHDSISESHFN